MSRIIEGNPAAAAVALIVCAAWLVLPSIARAGVVGSPHDFSATGPYAKTLGKGGACSPCHLPHTAADNVLWPRTLSDYRSKLYQRGGTNKPSFLLGSTIQCYDCHDYHGSGAIESPTSVPELGSNKDFTDAKHYPPDTMSGFRKTGIVSGPMAEDPIGGAIAGYYETNPPDNTTPSNYGVNMTAPPEQTGGHYFKQDPSTASTYDNGDKLPCNDCHDPHAWNSDGTWQAFIRKNWPSNSTVAQRLGLPSLPIRVQASANMGNPPTPETGGYGRLDSQSRLICIACHGDANTTLSVRFTEISTRYSSDNNIVSPRTARGLRVSDHYSTSSRACTDCHVHNSVAANCASCHGFPPGPYPPGRTATPPVSYPAGDPHARHVGSRDDGTSVPPYAFDCKVCHATSFLGSRTQDNVHNNGGMNIAFELTWLGVPNPPDNVSSPGGYVCGNLYCHSNGGSDNTMGGAGNYYRTPKWGTTPTLGCNGCHGVGTDNGILPNGACNYGMPGYASGPAGSATANSHSVHVVTNRIECSVCHAATVAGSGAARAILTAAPMTHINGLREVSFGGGVTGTYDNAAGSKRCSVPTCHGSDDPRWTPQWGGSLTGCTACHLRSAPDTDRYLSGIDNIYSVAAVSNIDNTEWFYSGHGKAAPGNYDSGNPAADLLSGSTGPVDACYYCHDVTLGHDNAANPFRLKVQTGAASYLASKGWNATCLVCHFHSTTPTADQPVGYDPSDYDGGTYQLKRATAAFVDNAHWGAEHGATTGGKFCWDCHDPHGDRPNGTTNNIYMIQGGTGPGGAGRAAPAVGTLLRQSDNVFGIRGSSGALTAGAPVFTGTSTGTNYADNTTYAGICQVCHTQASTGHYRYNYGDGHNQNTTCTQCHLHNGAFAGTGGPDIEQYFDNAYNSPGASVGAYNFWDNSRHPLANVTSGAMTFAAPMENCLSCHGATYKTESGRPQHFSNECIKCHFEHNGGASLGSNHMDKVLEFSTPLPNDAIPTTRYAINSLVDFDNWCLLCHKPLANISLGGVVPSGKTVIDDSAFTNGRHRLRTVGCIYCHQPHGSGNARLVRSNPANRGSAADGGIRGVPMRFNVYPNDNSGSYTGYFYASPNENIPYRARFDNVAPDVFADAGDENGFCNAACHDPSKPKDRVLVRDNTTGLYTLAPAARKVFLIGGASYTIDNISTAYEPHGHVNGEIISTDDMAVWYAGQAGLSGPSKFKYPGSGNANPATFNKSTSPLPMFPDYGDGARDFTNGYLNQGLLRYRLTCSTCHNPHGTTLLNAPGQAGYPDLRERSKDPSTLCTECHR